MAREKRVLVIKKVVDCKIRFSSLTNHTFADQNSTSSSIILNIRVHLFSSEENSFEVGSLSATFNPFILF